MATDDLQVVISARDQLSADVKSATRSVERLERALKSATSGTSGETSDDVERLTRELRDAQTAVRSLTIASARLDNELDQMGYSAKSAGRQVDGMSRKAKDGTGKMAGLGATMGKAGAAAAIAGTAILAAGYGIMRAATAAVEYEKKIRRTSVVFGQFAPKVQRWADANNEAFGASVADVAAYAAGVGDILKPLGFTTKAATKLTLGVGDLIPALAEWNTAGMDAEEVSHALTSALTGEREMLKSLGIVISEEDVKAKVAAMQAAGKFTDETDRQKAAIATLRLAIAGSSDALRSYNNNSDSATRKMAALKAGIGDVRDNGLAVFLSLWERISDAFAAADLGNPIRELARMLSENKDQIVGVLLTATAAVVRFGGAWLTMQAVVFKAVGGMVLAVGKLLDYMAFLDPRLKGAAQGAEDFGNSLIGMGDSAASGATRAGKLADALQNQAAAAFKAQENTKLLRDMLRDLPKNKTIRLDVQQHIKQTGSLIPYDPSYAYVPKDGKSGDTAAPVGVGHLGAAGLAAAHAGYAQAASGQYAITSGVRSHNLGSLQSDHRRGRAMDVTGDRLGAYARAVRRNGGYAAFHGEGGSRHLHVVPQTRRVAQVERGGDTFHAEVTVVNPSSGVDVQGAVARGLRQAAREQRERGG